MFIAADEVRKQLKIDYIDQTVFFLDGVLRQTMTCYQIKNAIEWERFQSGM